MPTTTTTTRTATSAPKPSRRLILALRSLSAAARERARAAALGLLRGCCRLAGPPCAPDLPCAPAFPCTAFPCVPALPGRVPWRFTEPPRGSPAGLARRAPCRCPAPCGDAAGRLPRTAPLEAASRLSDCGPFPLPACRSAAARAPRAPSGRAFRATSFPRRRSTWSVPRAPLRLRGDVRECDPEPPECAAPECARPAWPARAASERLGEPPLDAGRRPLPEEAALPSSESAASPSEAFERLDPLARPGLAPLPEPPGRAEPPSPRPGRAAPKRGPFQRLRPSPRRFLGSLFTRPRYHRERKTSRRRFEWGTLGPCSFVFCAGTRRTRVRFRGASRRRRRGPCSSARS